MADRPAGAEEMEATLFFLHRYRPAGAGDNRGNTFLYEYK